MTKHLLFTIACISLILGFSSCDMEKPAEDRLKDQPEGLYAEFYTSKGNILVKLEHEKTPMTVGNFAGLAEGKVQNTAKPLGTPYYDGLTFHRVIPDFMIQGGDPQGNGTGGPGYKFPDEIHPDLKHSGPGILSMANSGPRTNGSQFFITHKETPWLDGKHTVFGHVVEGQNVVDSIQQGDLMDSVRIYRKGASAESFDAAATFAEMSANWEKIQQEKIKAELESWTAEMKELYPEAEQRNSGLMYIIEKEGTGAQPAPGNTVQVHYTGTFLDGKVFDSSVERGEPIEFPLGQGYVIKGWDEGIGLLKEGGKARLVIPYQLAYGANGRPPAIPPKATLVFEVELVAVK